MLDILYAFAVGFAFVFVASCRIYFMLYRKPVRVCIFSALITVTWVSSARVAVSAPIWEIIVFGLGCMVGNLAAMAFTDKQDNLAKKE